MKTIFLTFFMAALAAPTFAQYDIFWADKSTSSITNFNEEKNESEVVTSDIDEVTRVKIDVVNQQIYWVEKNLGTFYKANLDGSNKTVVLKAKTKVSVFAIDHTNQLIYFAEDKNKRIMRANLDGSNPEEFVADIGMIKGIAFDESNQYVFYTDLIHGTISRKPMGGEEATILYSNEDLILFDLVADNINEQLYFSDRANNTISRIGFNGENLTVVLELNNLAGTIAIDPEFSRIFYKEGDQLNMANMDGTDKTMLAEGIKEISGLDIFNERLAQMTAQKK